MTRFVEIVTLSEDKVSTIQKGSGNVAQLVIWNAAKEYTEVMNLESGRVSNATISSNKGTWDKAGTSIQQSVDYNGVKMDATNGINVVSSQNTLLLNASKGIELKKKANNETLFGVDANGNLIVKGNITMVGGSIQWSSVTAPDYSQVQGSKPPADATNTWSDLTTDARYKGLFYTSNGNLVLKADAVVIGSNTKFDNGYDPTKIELGTSNLAVNGAFLDGTYNGWSKWGNPPKLWVDSQNTIKDSPKCISMEVNAANQGLWQDIRVTVGQTYTLSAWVWCKTGATIFPTIMANNAGTYPGVLGTKFETWERVSVTFVAKSTTVGIYVGRSGAVGTGTYSFVSVQLEEGNKVTDWKPSYKDVDKAVADVNNTVNNINIGGKNLLLKSNESRTTTDYLVKEYTLTENWVPGQEYTFVIKGTLPAGQVWGLWVNGSANRVAEVRTNWINGLMYVTFTCTAINAGFEKMLRLYNTPSNTTSSTVEWVALYKGNKAMDWTPAPEDVTNSINDINVGARNLVLESQLNLTTPWIYDNTVKIETGVMPNGVKNFMATVVGTGVYKDITQYIPVEGNTEYTLSLNAGGSFSTFLWEKKADKTPTAVYKDNAQAYSGIPWDMSSPRSRFTRTIRTQPDAKWIQFIFRVNGLVTGNTSGRMALAKLELGNKATDYSPAPEDFYSTIDNMNIGGNNIAVNSDFRYGMTHWSTMGGNITQSIVDVADHGTFTKASKMVIAATAADDNWTYTDYVVSPGDYMISAYFKSEGAQCSMGVRDGLAAPLVYNLQKVGEDQTGKNTWFRASFPVTFKTQYARIYFGTQKGTANGTLYVTGIQFEAGNKLTGWKQSTDDMALQISTVDIGGGNIVPNSNAQLGLTGWSPWSNTSKLVYPLSESAGYKGGGLVVRELDPATNTSSGVLSPKFSIVKDREYTISFVVGRSNSRYLLDYCYVIYNLSGVGNQSFTVGDFQTFPFYDNTRNATDVTYNTHRVTVTVKANQTSNNAQILIGFKSNDPAREEGIWLRYLQVEEGNKATSWKPCADDIQGQFDGLKSDYDKNKVDWGTAYSLVESWKGAAENGITTIKGGLLQTGTITANKLFLGDTTNLCENPDFESDANGAFPTGFTQTGNVRVKDISGFAGGNGSNRAMELDAINGYNNDVYSNSFIPVTPGQKFYVEAEARYLNSAGNGAGRLGFSCYNAKKQHMSVWSSAVYWTIDKNIAQPVFTKKGAIWTVPDNCYYVYIWISFQNNGETTNKFYIDNIRINRAASGEMIVDGAITANKINVNDIFSNSAVIQKIQTYDLSANRIVSGNLEVGGSQLASGTAWGISGLPERNKSAGLNMSIQKDSGEDYLVLGQAGATELFAYLKRVPMVGGKKITVSYDYFLDANVKGVDVFVLGSKYDVTEANQWQTGYDYVYMTSDTAHDERTTLGNGWFRVRKTFTLANDVKSALFRLDHNGTNNGANGYTRIRSLMVNYGNLAMDWQPHSDEDLSIGSITARQIAANSISAREIVAGSITTNELSVLAKQLVNNFSITKNFDGYVAGTQACSIVADPLGIKGNVMKMTTASDIQVHTDFFEVNPSKTYRLKVSAYVPHPTATTGIYFGFYVFDENKKEIPSASYIYETNTFESARTNPYFWVQSGAGALTFNKGWIDMEAVLANCNAKAPTDIPASKFVERAFILPTNARYVKMRFFHHYSKTSIDSYWAHPSVTEVDSGLFSFDQAQGGTLRLGTDTGNGFLQVVKQGSQGQRETVGQIDETGAYFPKIQADKIVGGGVVGIEQRTGQIFFDSINGNDNNDGTRANPKRNIQAYIDQMSKYISDQTELIQLNGNIDSPIIVKGFFGPGHFTIKSDNSANRWTINSGIIVRGVHCNFFIQHFILQGRDDTMAQTGTDSMIDIMNSPNVDIWFCKIYANKKVNMGITAVRGGGVRCTDLEIYDVKDRAFSIIYNATAYIKACKGGRNPCAILVSDFAVVQGEGSRPDGTIVRWANAYVGGYTGGGDRWVNDVWTVDFGEATPPPPPPPSEYVREWASLGGANWSQSGYWDDEWYVKQGNWGYGDRIGIWWFPQDMKNTLSGKTILDAQILLTRANKGGYSGSREARIVAHQYADQRPGNWPGVSQEFVSAWFSWGEQKWVNVTSFVQQKIANGVDKGLGLRFADSNANYMAFDYNAKIWVKYK